MPIDMRGLDGVAIDRQPFVVALPRGYHPAAKQKLTGTDLDGEALVMYAPIESRHPHELVSFPFRVAGIKPNFVQYAREIHTMLALVGGGLGVALVLKAY